MSLINDALKQARQAPPRNQPGSPLPPLRPVVEESSSVAPWLIPAIVIFLIVVAIFFIGWASAHHVVRSIVGAPDTTVITQQVEQVPPPVVARTPEPAPSFNPPDAPVLQGIFYSPTRPSAIVDGKTIRPGDPVRQYRVKEISKFSVTLVGPDKKEIKLGMDR